MVKTESTQLLPLSAPAPPFKLPDPSGRMLSLADVRGAPGLLIAFLCNHCPYVKHIREGFAGFAREYTERGLCIVAINSNDAEAVPEDAPERMAEEIEAAGYVFPYLVDADQSVARAYRAACTPDFFLFDRHGRLAYRGQFDGSRPGNDVPVTGEDLRAAADSVLLGRRVDGAQRPSLGCNIKWRAGHEPEWFPG
ncbi:MAG: thioredoxin family protein [Planctomycetota bacterium]|jgi:peroxiredoxin